jgi:histidinol dehydrogenase
MIPVRNLGDLSREDKERILTRGGFNAASVEDQVRPILEDVRERGDEALIEWTEKFDDFRPEPITVSKFDTSGIDPDVESAMYAAWANIFHYHQAIVPQSWEGETAPGVAVGSHIVPAASVGIYVPGGKANYPSSVLMNAAAAKAAGVPTIVMCTPGKQPAPEVLFAAQIAGIDRIYRLGGAQAIAAMAYGTESVAPVDVIVGPGNAYVAAAKQIVRDHVNIDFLAGPSEVCVVADKTAPADWVAADMLAHLEHDEQACALVLTCGDAVAIHSAFESQLAERFRKDIIRRAAEERAWILQCDTLNEALRFADRFAAEHLTLAVKDPQVAMTSIRNAGSIFLGIHSPVAVGDYCSGPNHVLPTLGEARRTGGLTPDMFCKRISWQELSAEGLEALADTTEALANAEGFEAHAHSVKIRRQS